MFQLPLAGSSLLVPLAIPHASEQMLLAVGPPAVCDLTGECAFMWNRQMQKWIPYYEVSDDEVSDDEDPASENESSEDYTSNDDGMEIDAEDGRGPGEETSDDDAELDAEVPEQAAGAIDAIGDSEGLRRSARVSGGAWLPLENSLCTGDGEHTFEPRGPNGLWECKCGTPKFRGKFQKLAEVITCPCCPGEIENGDIAYLCLDRGQRHLDMQRWHKGDGVLPAISICGDVRHAIHGECMRKWLNTTGNPLAISCPLCRG